MNRKAGKIDGLVIASFALGGVALWLTAATLGYGSFPFISGPIPAILAMTGIGVALSAMNGMHTARFKLASRGWVMAVSIVLGFITLLGIVAAFTGLPIPLMATPQEAFLVVSGTILIKWALVHLHNFTTTRTPIVLKQT